MARVRPPATVDHRAVVVELTPRGRALWRAMNVSYRRLVQQLVSSRLAADDDVDALRALLAALDPKGDAGLGCSESGPPN